MNSLFKDNHENINSEEWFNKSEVEELFEYIPDECEEGIVKFINSLTDLEPQEAIKAVDEYIKKLLKSGILEVKNEKDIAQRKKEYNEEHEAGTSGEDVFKENYEKVPFKGEGYGFIPGDKNPYFKAALLKIGKAFKSPNTEDAETANMRLLNSIEGLLFDFYLKYERAVEEVIN